VTATDSATPDRFTATVVPQNIPCGKTEVSNIYPNPVRLGVAAVHFDLHTACFQTVTWSVYTTANRKVFSQTMQMNGDRTASWDLKDKEGNLVAAGLYYLRVNTSVSGRSFLPVAVFP
jgi:hypothetical protein